MFSHRGRCTPHVQRHSRFKPSMICPKARVKWKKMPPNRRSRKLFSCVR